VIGPGAALRAAQPRHGRRRRARAPAPPPLVRTDRHLDPRLRHDGTTPACSPGDPGDRLLRPMTAGPHPTWPTPNGQSRGPFFRVTPICASNSAACWNPGRWPRDRASTRPTSASPSRWRTTRSTTAASRARSGRATAPARW